LAQGATIKIAMLSRFIALFSVYFTGEKS
jgi:hypothetical protein